MTSPLFTLISQYAGPAAIGIIIGLFFKMYFAARIEKKVKSYQGEIVRSHSRILHLEEVNGMLEKRVRELEGTFRKNDLVMN